MIQVKDLRKTFRIHKKEPGLRASLKGLFKRQWTEKEAVKGVTFTVEPGEILGLIGANGAGKTTLIKMLSGIIHPTSGEARVLGFEPWKRPVEFRRQIALAMGQKAQLWWDLPAADCFLLLREIYQIPDAEYRTTLDLLTGTLNVKSELTTPIRKLSLGERMKMELIATLLHRPRVVFLDEPTIGLDITSQRAIRKFILDYRREYKPAMIVTSHYMEDIEALCERVILIRDGQFAYDGPLAKIAEQTHAERVISAHIDPDWRGELPVSIQDHGTLLESTPGIIRLKVQRHKTSQSAGFLLSSLPVVDLSIEGEDISTLIAKIMDGPKG